MDIAMAVYFPPVRCETFPGHELSDCSSLPGQSFIALIHRIQILFFPPRWCILLKLTKHRPNSAFLHTGVCVSLRILVCFKNCNLKSS